MSQQRYHSNAKTNIHVRQQIRSSFSSNDELATRFQVSVPTISKWKNRELATDASSRPHHIAYALSNLETALAVSVRQSSWLPLDEVFEMLLPTHPTLSRSSVYRCLQRNNLNKVPQAEKEKAKTFKAYQPGYLHIDVTYLPKLDKQACYLFVAIDRATRTLFYKTYDNKTAQSTDDFFDECLNYFPFTITHILTDNGLEFTNRLIKSKMGNRCEKPSLLDQKCTKNNIQHRLTKPCTPKTNGMVERVNGTIKNNTTLRQTYTSKTAMNSDLMAFLEHYNLYRRHGSLRKELNVKTPFEAVLKWHQLMPEIFKITPQEFKAKILNLNTKIIN